MWLWSKRANDIASVHSQSYGLSDRWQKTSPLNWPIRSLYRVEYHQLTWYNSVWLWRWLPHRLSKREWRSTITVLSRALSPIQDSYSYSTQPTYELTPGFKSFTKIKCLSPGALHIQPKILEISVRNQMERTISVRTDGNNQQRRQSAVKWLLAFMNLMLSIESNSNSDRNWLR